MNPQHGDHDPQHGWYDATRNGWVTDPARLGRITPGQRQPNDQDRSDYERQQARRRGDFEPDPTLERWIRLRNSDRPEDRAAFAQLVNGRQRITLQQYEQRKRTHQERQQA